MFTQASADASHRTDKHCPDTPNPASKIRLKHPANSVVVTKTFDWRGGNFAGDRPVPGWPCAYSAREQATQPDPLTLRLFIRTDAWNRRLLNRVSHPSIHYTHTWHVHRFGCCTYDRSYLLIRFLGTRSDYIWAMSPARHGLYVVYDPPFRRSRLGHCV